MFLDMRNIELYQIFINKLNNISKIYFDYTIKKNINRAFILLPQVLPIFLNSKNVNFTENENIEINKLQLTNLFTDFLYYIEFYKPYGFQIEEIFDRYKKIFIESKIFTNYDINKDSLILLCKNIYNNLKDNESYENTNVLYIVKSYLQTINEIPEEEYLSIEELYYYDERLCPITERICIKEIINQIEGNNWIKKYNKKKEIKIYMIKSIFT